MENIEVIVGKRVRELRISKKMSQTDLAKKAKTSLTTINRLEKGHQYPRYDTIAEIAKALGVTESDLFRDPNATSNPEKLVEPPSDSDLRELISIIGRLDRDSIRTLLKDAKDLLAPEQAAANDE